MEQWRGYVVQWRVKGAAEVLCTLGARQISHPTRDYMTFAATHSSAV